MIRRSFRIGLTLGLVGGLAVAMVKLLRPRPSAEPAATPSPAAPWPELKTDPAVPARPSTSLQTDPAAPRPAVPAATEKAPAAPLRTDAVAEPEQLEVVPDRAAPAKAARPAPKQAAQPPAKAAKAAKKPAARKPAKAWVEPSGEVCPTSHPVKAKLTSKIFHLPGMLNYERTRPDRCYRDAEAAEGDGLRAAKR